MRKGHFLRGIDLLALWLSYGLIFFSVLVNYTFFYLIYKKRTIRDENPEKVKNSQLQLKIFRFL